VAVVPLVTELIPQAAVAVTLQAVVVGNPQVTAATVV
jgi:hypothetical protein